MTKQVKQFDRHIESVLASLDLLDCFLHQPRLTIKDIIERTGMTRNRISRILGTLIYKGYVLEGVDAGSYTPGPKLMALGRIFESNQNLVVVARPILQELALKSGESASFYVREGHERVVVAREEGTDSIRFSVQAGQRMDLHAGAAGKVLLAYSSEAEQHIILTGRQLRAITKNTTINPGALLAELEEIRARGYAVSRGERNPDAYGIAAPVFERREQLLGAVSIAGPISRLNPVNEARYLRHLLDAARVLSGRFGVETA